MFGAAYVFAAAVGGRPLQKAVSNSTTAFYQDRFFKSYDYQYRTRIEHDDRRHYHHYLEETYGLPGCNVMVNLPDFAVIFATKLNLTHTATVTTHLVALLRYVAMLQARKLVHHDIWSGNVAFLLDHPSKSQLLDLDHLGKKFVPANLNLEGRFQRFRHPELVANPEAVAAGRFEANLKHDRYALSVLLSDYSLSGSDEKISERFSALIAKVADGKESLDVIANDIDMLGVRALKCANGERNPAPAHAAATGTPLPVKKDPPPNFYGLWN